MNDSNDLKKSLIPVEEESEIVRFATQQLHIFWLPDEIKVEKDIHDVLTNFSESEKHAVITTLKLFSLYETHAGDEYWGKRYKEIFNTYDFHRMASVFSMFELAVHSPFYSKINRLLNLDTPEFYLQYQQTPVMKDRIEHISNIIDDPDDLVSLAGFSLVEGVILYSSFAFLKHYQSEGKNKLLNLVRGINFSVRDENLHAEAGAWSFKYKLAMTNLTPEQKETLKQKIISCAKLLYEHEKEIAKITFEKGNISGITESNVVSFVEHRINHCLKRLGYDVIFEENDTYVSSWFYKGINDYQANDIFSGIGSQYNRNWNETAFTWKND
jgi:ribonucleotide reductase beta subunit family protein with ferritin-like domain